MTFRLAHDPEKSKRTKSAPLELLQYQEILPRELLASSPLPQRVHYPPVEYFNPGERIWRYITLVHPHGSPEQPAWHEAYAEAASWPSYQIPRYIREFYPWRDWAELEEMERRQAIREFPERRARFQDERAALHRREVTTQAGTEMGMTPEDFQRSW